MHPDLIMIRFNSGWKMMTYDEMHGTHNIKQADNLFFGQSV
jgi:hypothetical protein